MCSVFWEFVGNRQQLEITEKLRVLLCQPVMARSSCRLTCLGVGLAATLTLNLIVTCTALECQECDSSNSTDSCETPRVVECNQTNAACVVRERNGTCDGAIIPFIVAGCGTGSRPGHIALCGNEDLGRKSCCSDRDECNKDTIRPSAHYASCPGVFLDYVKKADSTAPATAQPTAAPPGAESAGPPQSVVVVVAVLASLVGVGLVAALAMTLARHRRRRRKCVEVNVASPRLYTTAMLHSEITSCDSGCIMGESSGRGELQLEERTISREIELREQIGTGRFGEVYRGMWKENEVAVKIFKTIEQASFYQEVDLFNTCMLRHQNILGFRAADNRDFNMELQLWMVLDYHCHGSLYDYLRRHSTQNPSPNRKWLGRDDLHKLALSVSAGLMHLHNHIDGQSFGNKPGIAHRDLKTKNILVKQDGTCCIADLGMAVRNCPSQNSIQYMDKTNLKVGTKRYMAPEILDDSINYEKFASFRRVDIYALALVLWEIMTVCCPAPGELPTYKFPFEESVPGDPSVEDMHAVVCTRKLRPAFPSYWTEDKSLGVILRIIRMSWKEQPHSRFSANRVWRNLHPSEPVTSDSMLSPE